VPFATTFSLYARMAKVTVVPEYKRFIYNEEMLLDKWDIILLNGVIPTAVVQFNATS